MTNNSTSKKADTISALSADSGAANDDNCWGMDIHVSVLTDLKNNKLKRNHKCGTHADISEAMAPFPIVIRSLLRH